MLISRMRVSICAFITSAMVCLPLPAAVLHTPSGGLVKTLDPIQAEDLASRNLTALVYDTLLQYDYTARPYRLKPSMVTAMPKVSDDFKYYEFELRDDLYFSDDAVFSADKSSAKVTVEDVKFSLLRSADIRNHSPVYWMFRGKIAGLEEFRKKSGLLDNHDNSIYDEDLPGFKKISDRKFAIILKRSDPHFLYMLAMPNAGIVSRRAAEFYGEHLARHPVGSGPFVLKEWIANLRLEFRRNPGFRAEYFSDAPDIADRNRKLPLLDAVKIYQIRQPMSSWMMFLQGNVDINVLDKDNLSQLTFSGRELIPALKARGIKLARSPEFEIRYIGFNFDDPLLGKNVKLRQALSLAYNVQRRVTHVSGQLLPAQGPIPPGVAGYDPDFINPFAVYDLEKAKKLLAEAGFPGGIDPATGKPLKFTFDQSGTDTSHRQMGELAVDDWRKLGIEVDSVLNSKPRFFDKLRQGKFQLFRLSWVGDYPDAENFLQLFSSANIGGCNRCRFSDPETDQLFNRITSLPNSEERTELCKKMSRKLAEKCAWIYEGVPISCELHHAWLKNFIPHDFHFVRWKYLDVDENLRNKLKSTFRPLSFRELSGK